METPSKRNFSTLMSLMLEISEHFLRFSLILYSIKAFLRLEFIAIRNWQDLEHSQAVFRPDGYIYRRHCQVKN
jgi:hypothetical protein